jgi:hypothetical protein
MPRLASRHDAPHSVRVSSRRETRPLWRKATGQTPAELRAAVDALTPVERLAAYHRGEFTYQQLYIWAARYPYEVPLVNGEFEFIALTMADLDED